MAAKAIAILALLVTLSSQAIAGDVLYGGDTLHADQFIENGPYKFIMQSDCNLVLYNNGNALWSSGTYGKAANCKAVMQRDANLVVYSRNGALWSSGTAREQGNYILTVQADGNVVIYGAALWSTNTYVLLNGTAKDSRKILP